MRMVHYFAGAALAAVGALLAATLSGLLRPGSTLHLSIGLFAGISIVGVHSLFIVFMIVTGRVLREAMRARPLGPGFLTELNAFFARRRAYPLAVGAAAAMVAAAVLGYAQRGFGLSPAVHVLAGLAAVMLNLWALQSDWLELRRNQTLVDRAAAELDRLDEAARARGEDPAPPQEAPEPARLAHAGLLIAVSAWMPYLYWALVVWRGDFARVSPHPWLEISALGLLMAVLARRAGR